MLAPIQQLVGVWWDEVSRHVSQYVAIEPGGGQERESRITRTLPTSFPHIALYRCLVQPFASYSVIPQG